MSLRKMTEQEMWLFYKKRRCPVCLTHEPFLEGPSGGAATNVQCANPRCEVRLNVGFPGFGEVIGEPKAGADQSGIVVERRMLRELSAREKRHVFSGQGCPFCGSDDAITLVRQGSLIEQVECLDCGSQQRLSKQGTWGHSELGELYREPVRSVPGKWPKPVKPPRPPVKWKQVLARAKARHLDTILVCLIFFVLCLWLLDTFFGHNPP